MRSVPLSPQHREDSLAAMAATDHGDVLDVLVVGGGVVGAGAALDAVTRGLSVGLVEARDFASGTSSRSSKLMHGGLRYLEMLDFGLVAEALRERGLMLDKLAPHLVRPVPFLYPLTRRGWERFYVGAGVGLYDAMSRVAGTGDVPLHKHLTRRGARKLAPALRKDALVGALRYYDAQVDDARHTMFIARTAAAYGSHVANRARVTELLREGERVTGAVVHDLESDRRITVRARQVVNATGVWTDETQDLAGRSHPFNVRASKGVHLVVPKDRIRSEVGMILRTEKSVLFVIPWGRHWIIGTTDTDWDLDKAHPAASEADIDYLLEHINAVLERPLTRDDVEGVYAGLRPLLSGESDATSKLSREHAVSHPAPGLVVVAGGKYTTYRVMAKDVIDEAVHGLETHAGRKVASSVTEDVPLLGAEGWSALWNARQLLADRSGLHEARIEHLLNRYGSLVHELLDLIAADPSLAESLTGAPDHLRAEIAYAASHEGARHLDDALTRRTRLSIETFDRGLGAVDEAADLMADVLGWSEEQKAVEIEHYRARVQAERESQQMPDDETADAARVGAPDMVPLS